MGAQDNDTHTYLISDTDLSSTSIQPTKLEETTHSPDVYLDVNYTGDSGFTDAKEFLKPDWEELHSSQPQTEATPAYMELKQATMDPVGIYKTFEHSWTS